MSTYNYSKLMQANPMQIGEFINSANQTIRFVEHPKGGDFSPIIAISDDLQLASDTDFFELDEIMEVGGEYETIFRNGELCHGDIEWQFMKFNENN